MFVIVIGAGITGKSASRYLAARGDAVLLYDDHQVEPEDSPVKSTTDLDYVFAELKRADALVLSPSVPLTHAVVRAARAAQVRVMSEVDLALASYQGTIVAVTGTNGKSTVCQYIQHLLQKNNCDSVMAGNSGIPATSILLDHQPAYLVLELSSYQLAQSHLPAVKVAVFTNFSADHLQYHRDLASYFKAKSSIFVKAELAISDAEVFSRLPQKKGKHLVVADELAVGGCADFFQCVGTKVLHQQRSVADFGALAPHDVSNAMMAVLAVRYLIGVGTEQLVLGIADCAKLPHRLQYIGSSRGYALINDSKATNVEATLAALQAQPEPVLLIVGGASKNQTFKPLLTHRDKINKLYVFGADGEQIYAELASHLPCRLFPSLATVMASLKAELHSLKSRVLFSPACATDTEFKDFAARGDAFIACLQ